MHVRTKLRPFDNKEISASLRFHLDKLITLLLTNCLVTYSLKVQLDYHLHFFLLQSFQSSLLLKFRFQSPSMHFCMNSFNSLALTTFFQIYFHYYCRWYTNPRGNTSSQNQGHFFLERDAPTKTFVLLSILFYLFHFVSCTLFLIFILSDFCIPIKHGFLNVFHFEVDI